MPLAAAKPCKVCSAATRNRPAYCDAHAHVPAEREAKRRAALDRQRGSASRRGYGYRWQKARVAFLGRHPLCAEHQRQGQIVDATVVDHIIPHRGDPDLFWDEANWQPLCKLCHDSKTAREDGGFRGAIPHPGAGSKF